MRRSSLALVLTLAFALGAGTVAAQAATLGPQFLGGPGKKAKPRTIGVGAKGQFEKLRWRNWGKANAYARGVYDIAGFATDPGSGYRSSIRIRAYGRKTCGGGNVVYTKVRYRVNKSIGGRKVFAEKFSTC